MYITSGGVSLVLLHTDLIQQNIHRTKTTAVYRTFFRHMYSNIPMPWEFKRTTSHTRIKNQSFLFELLTKELAFLKDMTMAN
jgi:hypothetical protein